MKPEIHPVYVPSKISCACGSIIETQSTRGSFSVEICANCHPFFTGKYKLIDTAGRIDRFNKKYGSQKAADAVAQQKVAVEKKKAKTAKKSDA